jgi:acetate kinase
MDPRPALVLNAGSSSVKAALLATDGTRLWRGQQPGRPTANANPDAVVAWLAEPLESEPPALVGHRVVHGGEQFTGPTRLSPAVRAELAELVPLAPLHNGPALRLIEALAQRWPQLPQWACFDTAFHATLPAESRTYALPARWRQAGLRRFGFHGLNHEHVAERVAHSNPGAKRLISCHLGAGCSLCAIRDGRSIATTMGFTPLEGLVMATRSGSVDPGLLLHLLRGGVPVEELDRSLNGESGLLGLSGLSSDMRQLRRAEGEGHAGAALAIGVFRQRLLQEIGAMAASLGGVDVIALSGGIGENDRALHQELAQSLGWLGPVRLEVVPADEEGLIARRCRAAAAAGN